MSTALPLFPSSSSSPLPTTSTPPSSSSSSSSSISTWFILRLNKLNTEVKEDAQSLILSAGLTTLSKDHLLHEIYGWIKDKWFKNINKQKLSIFLNLPSVETLIDLGYTYVYILECICQAIKKCHAQPWLLFISIMLFDSHDHLLNVDAFQHHQHLLNSFIVPMDFLYNNGQFTHLDQAILHLTLNNHNHNHTLSHSHSTNNNNLINHHNHNHNHNHNHGHGHGHAVSVSDLSNQIQHLQSQINDLSNIIIKNEDAIQTLSSSFQFWSISLLDEMRNINNNSNTNSNDNNDKYIQLKQTINSNFYNSPIDSKTTPTSNIQNQPPPPPPPPTPPKQDQQQQQQQQQVKKLNAGIPMTMTIEQRKEENDQSDEMMPIVNMKNIKNNGKKKSVIDDLFKSVKTNQTLTHSVSNSSSEKSKGVGVKDKHKDDDIHASSRKKSKRIFCDGKWITQ